MLYNQRLARRTPLSAIFSGGMGLGASGATATPPIPTLPTLIAHVIEAGVTSSAVNTTGANFHVVTVGGGETGYGTVSDSLLNIWTQVPSTHYENVIYYAANAMSGPSQTFTVSGIDSTSLVFGVMSFSNMSANPLDQYADGTTNSPLGVTPTKSHEVVIGGANISYNPSVAPTGCTGLTFLDSAVSSNANGGADGYVIQTTAASITPAWTVSQTAYVSIASFFSTAST